MFPCLHTYIYIFLSPNLVLVLVFVVYNRRREAQIKYPNPDDDVRENIINYEDEVRHFWNLKWYFIFKIVLTYYEKKISSDKEKILKLEAEGLRICKILGSLELDFIRTVFETECFFNLLLGTEFLVLFSSPSCSLALKSL